MDALQAAGARGGVCGWCLQEPAPFGLGVCAVAGALSWPVSETESAPCHRPLPGAQGSAPRPHSEPWAGTHATCPPGTGLPRLPLQVKGKRVREWEDRGKLPPPDSGWLILPSP